MSPLLEIGLIAIAEGTCGLARGELPVPIAESDIESEGSGYVAWKS